MELILKDEVENLFNENICKLVREGGVNPSLFIYSHKGDICADPYPIHDRLALPLIRSQLKLTEAHMVLLSFTFTVQGDGDELYALYVQGETKKQRIALCQEYSISDGQVTPIGTPENHFLDDIIGHLFSDTPDQKEKAS